MPSRRLASSGYASTTLPGFILPCWIPDGLEFAERLDQLGPYIFVEQLTARLAVAVLARERAAVLAPPGRRRPPRTRGTARCRLVDSRSKSVLVWTHPWPK